MKTFSLIIFCLLSSFFSRVLAQSESRTTRPMQVTFIAPLGTNGVDAPEYSNIFSLNILTGINGGVEGFEVGGLVNVITGAVEGAQIAGLANYVHEELSGVQIGGLFNVTRGFFEGAQLGGLGNLSFGEGLGLQIAGLLNINRGSLDGIQMAGLINANTAEIDGFQAAGLINFAGGEVSAGQIAGLINVALANAKGIQIGGLVSVSGNSIEGSQISGLVNVAAQNVSGVQIGLVNVAKHVEGAQLGLISYAGNGFVNLAIQTNETFMGQFIYKMGLKKLYNIYAVGGNEGKNRYWAPGLGLGSYLLDGQKAALNVEGLAYHINEKEVWTDEMNMLARLNLNFHYHIIPNLSLVGGISLNEAISRVRNGEGQLTGGSFVPSWTFAENKDGKTATALYPGFNLGLEFRLKR